MKKVIALLLLSIFTAPAAVAEDAANQPEQGGAKKELNTMVKSLSNLLSATNPKAADTQTAAQREAEYREKVKNLPPLNPNAPQNTATIKQQPVIEPVPQPMNLPQPVIQQEDVARLSPETKRLLRSSPSNIGGREIYKKEKLILERGGFDPEGGVFADTPIDSMENMQEVEQKPKFEIEVKNTRSATTTEELLGKALAALRAGQYEAAIVSYKAALMKDGKNRDALFGLATAYHQAGQKAQAKAAYAKLLSVYPKYQAGWNNLLILASDEAPQDALVELNNLSARNPNFAPIYAQKAAIYSKMGDNAKVKENYLKAVKLQPDNLTYKYNLAVFLDKNGEIRNAVQLYNELIEQSQKGAQLPVDRNQLIERVAYIGASRNS